MDASMAAMDPTTWLLLCRTVRFGDTDAAGVIHFHQLLRWCHEAWEESLERFGISAAEIFPAGGPPGSSEATAPPVALPIVHCSADFRRPLVCGDPLTLQLQPERLDPSSFEVRTTVLRGDELVAQGLIRHVAIGLEDRRRCGLPEPLQRWLEASALGGGVRPL
jgi:1,4-dihydroxy-2-naphthoyl-CoA hydrolase